ncbi:unnamed protein product [Closterium sp. Naga37s-1]|nr:unnamed protein product [Closterium sp. Naga37s-1]
MDRRPLLVVLLLALSSSAHAWNYVKSGQDWTGACQTSRAQSPINIEPSMAVKGKDLRFLNISYALSKSLTVSNFGFTGGVQPQAGTENFMYTSTGKFRLLGILLRASSEHTILGAPAPLEAHFVHENVANPAKGAIISVMIVIHKNNVRNPWLDKWLPYIPKAVNTSVSVPATTNFKEALNVKYGFWYYRGSTTYPPCAPNIEWFILKRGLYGSVEQIEGYMNLLAASSGQRTNNRLPRPINGRTIISYPKQRKPKRSPFSVPGPVGSNGNMQEPHTQEPRHADETQQQVRRESKSPPPASTLSRDEASLRSSKAPTPAAGTPLPRATSAPVGASSTPSKEDPAAAKPGSKSLAELVRDTDLEPDEEVARYGEMKNYVEAMAKNRSPEKGAAEGGEGTGSSTGAFSGKEGHAIPDEEVKHQKPQQRA